MSSGTPIYEHGFSDEMLEDLKELRSMRVDLVKKQIADVVQTQQDIMERDLFGSEVVSVDELREALLEKLEVLEVRLENPKAIYTDEIEFFLDVAQGQ